jgi:hypothetical protein
MTLETRMPLLALITGGAFAAAGAFLCAYMITVNRHLSAGGRKQKPGICFYLDVNNAMDLYLQGDYPSLQRSVQSTTRRNIVWGLLLRLPFIGGAVNRAAGHEQVVKYFEDVEPITVIGRIIRALDEANDIVYVDLFNRAIGPSTGLNRALQPTHGKKARQISAARLRELEPVPFVSVTGRFRVTAKTEATTTFSAPYGDPAEFSGDLPKVSVTCVTDQLRHEQVPDRPFRARCLGKISWDPGTRELTIYPVLAIFL